MKSVQDMEFVIFDVETTGLSPQTGDRVIEVAAARVKGLQPVEKFYSLINPERTISYDAFLVNGISQEMVDDAPTACEIFPQLMAFIGDACLVGHNIKFDIGFLKNELQLIGVEFDEEIPTLDTVRMSRALLPENPRHSLLYVSRSLGIEKGQDHRALSDVLLTFEVFKRLLSIAERKDIADTATLMHLFGNSKSLNKFNMQKASLIKDAIFSRKDIQFLYFGSRGDQTTCRTVTPQKIVGRGANMSLVGFCHLRNQERKFKVNRMINPEKVSS